MQDLQSRRFPSLSDEEITELQLMQDTNLLLENLAEREKVTVKAILDGLYEVGAARLINQKISVKSLRGPFKGIARFSKPVFRMFAWRWFKKNCPELITYWLYEQVRFGDRPPLPLMKPKEDQDLIDVVPIRNALPPIVEQQAEEILALRGRVTLLTLTVVILSLVVCVKIFS
jgi:hypothetical protein